MLVPGTAVFLTSDPQSAPTALMHSLKHYKVLHEQNVILSVVTAQQPSVPDSERVSMEKINDLFMRVTLTFGYMEQPNIPKALAICRKQGWKFDIMTTSFFLSRRSLKASPNSGMPVWQDRLFIGWPAPPPTPPNISRSRPGASSRSAPRWRSEARCFGERRAARACPWRMWLTLRLQ